MLSIFKFDFLGNFELVTSHRKFNIFDLFQNKVRVIFLYQLSIPCQMRIS